MLPELQAILEEVQEGTSLHGRLALMVAGLADAETKLGDQREGGGEPAQYNLYDEDSQHDGWEDEDRQGGDDGGRDIQGDGTGAGCRDGRPTEWRAEGPGRWTRAGPPRAESGHQRPSDAMGNAEGNHPNPQSTGEGGTRKARATEDTTGGDGDGTACTRDDGVERHGEDGDEARRAGKHRRRQTENEAREEARAASDARRAQELRRQLEYASAAQEQSFQEGNGGFGSEVALSLAAQKFVLDLQRAQAQAGEMGIEPCAEDGRSLLQLSPAELKQWVGDNLENDAMCD